MAAREPVPGLDRITSIYQEIGSAYAAVTHPLLRASAHRIAAAVEAHRTAGAPTGYLESARRIGSAQELAVQARDLSRETVDLLGDTSQLLRLANEGLELVKAYVEACEIDDERLREELHAAQMKRKAKR